MRIVVTGGNGKGGRMAVRELQEHGHDVLSLDITRGDTAGVESRQADLTDLGQCLELIAGAEAVVHFAAIPGADIRAGSDTFRNNVLSTYNVFAAAVDRGASRVVWASSETVLGLPFEDPPAFAPIDETHPPRPESSYALSKLVGETMADQFARRSRTTFLGLRISNIMEPHDYARFETWQDDPQIRRWNLWSYVDGRDVAAAVRQGLDADLQGAEIVILAAADTVMRRESADLMAEVFPTVELRGEDLGRQSLLSSERARRLMGYEPAHGWLDSSA